MAFTSQRWKGRGCVWVLPSLVAHVVGYGTQSPTLLFMTCCTWQATQCSPTLLFMTWQAAVFAWDGKRRRPQYCLCSDASGRLYSVRLTWPDGTVLQVRRACQGTVLGITVDLSALPYLLRLLLGPTPSRRPGRLFPVSPDCVGREREASKGPAYPRSEERGQSRTTISSWLGLSVGVATRSPGRRRRLGTESWSRPIIMYLGWTRRVLLLRRLLDRVL